jgi:hypothetical protein
MDLGICRCPAAGVRGILACLIVTGLFSVGLAQGPGTGRPGFGSQPGFVPRGQAFGQPPFGQPDLGSLLKDAQGLLFINDRFVPLPCAMRVESDQLVVADLVVACKPAYEEEQRPFRQRRPAANARYLGHELANHLAIPQVVVAIADQPLVVISNPRVQNSLLRKLARLESDSVQPVSYLEDLPDGFDRDVWNEWVAEFQPTPEFVSRAVAYVEVFERAEREGQAAIAATRRLQDWSYFLSLAGMIGAVLGFGHLLSHRPPVGAKSLDTDASPLTMRMLTYTLTLIVLYSGLDLTWTILAHQAGQMLELNPLGSRLVEDPMRLIAFKVGATGLAVGLLFWLRKYCRAQLAAWWLCLILTLLTARWLMMSSMFVA